MSRPKGQRAPRPVLQQRAQATLEALVTAGELLLDGRDPHTIALEEILARAGASASSFYQRFGSKERFLDHLHERFCDRVTAEADAWIARARVEQRPLEDRAREGVEGYLAFRRKHMGALMSLEILEAQDPDLRARRTRVDLAVLSRVRGAVLAMRTRDGREVRAERLDLALDLVVSMVRGAADGARRAHVHSGVTDPELADQLVAAVLAYLVD